MSEGKNLPPRRQYPRLYEKGVPIVLGLIVLVIVILLIAIFAIALGLFPGS